MLSPVRLVGSLVSPRKIQATTLIKSIKKYMSLLLVGEQEQAHASKSLGA